MHTFILIGVPAFLRYVPTSRITGSKVSCRGTVVGGCKAEGDGGLEIGKTVIPQSIEYTLKKEIKIRNG